MLTPVPNASKCRRGSWRFPNIILNTRRTASDSEQQGRPPQLNSELQGDVGDASLFGDQHFLRWKGVFVQQLDSQCTVAPSLPDSWTELRHLVDECVSAAARHLVLGHAITSEA